MSKTHSQSDIFWVFLFLEINLIIVNFQTLLGNFFALSIPNNFFLIHIASKLIINIALLILAIWLFGTRKKIVNNMRYLVQEKDGIWISAIFYLGASCTVMYFLEFTS
jgi:two-component system sensor histidine kinase AgrC